MLVMDHIGHGDVTKVVHHSWVVHNHQVTSNVTMHTDTSLMLHGVLEVMVLDTVVVVPEVVKVLSLFRSSTDERS